MLRSARVVGLEEKEPEPSAAAAALEVVTGLEEYAISPDALLAAEASRRAYDTRHDDGRRGTFLVECDGEFALQDWLAQPTVKRELQKAERVLSNVQNGTATIEDVNMHYAVLAVDFDQIDRFVKAGGRCRREMIQPTRTAQHHGRGCGTPTHARSPLALACARTPCARCAALLVLRLTPLPRAQVICAPITRNRTGRTPRTPSLRPPCSNRRSRSGN